MKRTTLTIIAILILLNGFAQKSDKDYTQTIRGIVYDKDTEVPLQGIDVFIKDSEPTIGTTTDIDGRFELKEIPVGRVNLTFSAMGYHLTALNNMELISSKELNLTIHMEEKVFKVDEIIVRPNTEKHLPGNKMALISSRSFTVEETKRYAGSIGDPSRMAGNYAGVMAVNDSRNDIIIRGNSPSGVLWRLDGFDIPNPNHFSMAGSKGGVMSMLNNNQLANSDFLTGAFPAEYGDALSGAFDLKLRNGNTFKREHMLQLATSGFELGTEGPFSSKSSSSYIFNYRYSAPDVFHKLGLSDDETSEIPQYQDLSFKVNFPKTAIGQIQLFALAGTNSIIQDSRLKDSTDWSYGLMNMYMDMTNNMAVTGLTNTIFIDKSTRIINKFSYQITENKFRLDSVQKDKNLKFFETNYNKLTKAILKSEFKKKFNVRNSFHMGVSFETSNINRIDSAFVKKHGKVLNEIDIDDDIYSIKAFAQHKHKFSNKLNASIGLFYHKLSIDNAHSIEPRVAAKWQVKSNQSLNFGYGIHSQQQNLNTYFLESFNETTGEYTRSNENLGFSKSQHFVLGYNYLLRKNLRLKMEGYYQNLWDIPVSESTPQFSMLNTGGSFGSPVMENMVNDGTGKNYGLELTLEKFRSNGYYYLITGSLFDSKYKDYNGDERNTEFNGNFAMNALVGYEFKIRKNMLLDFNLKGMWAGGRRKLDVNREASQTAKEIKYRWDNAYENKYPDYYKLDLRIGLKTNHKNWSEEFAIDITNVTDNTANVIGEYYDLDNNSFTKDYQNGIMFNFLYKIYF